MRTLLLALLVLLLAPAAAQAGTVRIVMLDSCGGDPDCSRSKPGTPVPVVKFTAQPGEANKLGVRPEGDAVVVRDDGTGLGAGEGCAVVDGQTVRCPLRKGGGNQGVQVFQADLSDADDEVTIDGDLGGRAVLEGGDGADTLNGGAEFDLLEGGPGADRLDGGEGDDAISYSDRSEPVRVDLDRGEATEGGETDKLAGIESVTGGRGADTLIGGDEADLLAGGPGDDRVDGGDGKDTLLGDRGDDRLDGGAGADAIQGGAGRDRITGGGGRDMVSGGGGRDRIDVRGGGRDRVQGARRDRVQADRRDRVTR